MKLLFDIESDNLLEDTTVIHCAVIYSFDLEKTVRFGPSEIQDFIDLLSQGTTLLGHNIISFDLPVLQKLHNWKPSEDTVIRDTLVMSRLMFSNRAQLDVEKRSIPPKLFGKHSLEAWGHRLKYNKGSFGDGEVKDFSVYVPEMLDYCERDVLLNLRLYNFLAKQPFTEESIQMEQDIHSICLQQEHDGFPFDVTEAGKFYGQLSQKRQRLHEELKRVFGTWIEVEEHEFVPKASNKKRGTFKGVPYTKIKFVEFNPNSRAHIAKRLTDIHGWKPKDLTPTGDPKIDESVLSKLKYPEAQLMASSFRLNKIIGMLAEGNQGWLKLQKKGRLHGAINTMGTVASRCSHHNPNLGQVPSTKVEYGEECRRLFYAPAGFNLVGCDVSGLEIRVVAHYLYPYDDGEFAKTVLEGDIHTSNQKAAGLETRAQAKTFIYGLLYGAGDLKLGQIVGKGVKEGKRLKENFFASVPAFKQFRDAVYKKAEKGFIRGIDGRRVPVRAQHSSVNALCQSAGAIICKRWVVEFHKLMKERGYVSGKDYQQVGFVHDEIQVLAREGLEDVVGSTAVEAISVSGDIYGVRIPLTGEYKVGKNWAETH